MTDRTFDRLMVALTPYVEALLPFWTPKQINHALWRAWRYFVPERPRRVPVGYWTMEVPDVSPAGDIRWRQIDMKVIHYRLVPVSEGEVAT